MTTEGSMIIKLKKLSENATIPTYAKDGDAGLDLYAAAEPVKTMDQRGYYLTFKTGIAVEIPQGYVGLIYPRSSISKTSLTLSNCVGVIDSGYRGEITLIYRDNVSGFTPRLQYKAGDKIAQLMIMPYPKIEFELVEELTSSERADGSFGSSGN